ncbi:MAG TPA: adenylyl-sulfate kinase, partial [Alphaproteobacteria bacterium]|nr:adenylyl-sulfate kinase [Alphaproteobacteria bacterium]
FTGIDSPYEPPENPDLIVDTQFNDVDTCVEQIVNYIEANVRVDKNNNKATAEGRVVAIS